MNNYIFSEDLLDKILKDEVKCLKPVLDRLRLFDTGTMLEAEYNKEDSNELINFEEITQESFPNY